MVFLTIPPFFYGEFMAFDLQKFEQAKITQRTKEVETPLLKDFFGPDEKPVWVIRALSSEDIAIVNEAQERNKNMGVILSAMLGKTGEAKAAAIKSAVGIGDELPDDLVRRIEIMLRGSVELDTETHRDIVTKIAMYYPTTFMQITNEILQISGEGGFIEGKR